MSPRKGHELSGLSSECSSLVCVLEAILLLPTLEGTYETMRPHMAGDIGVSVYFIPPTPAGAGHQVPEPVFKDTGGVGAGSCVSGESLRLLRRSGG